jgi:hyperosmotically inducible periplasmic protein
MAVAPHRPIDGLPGAFPREAPFTTSMLRAQPTSRVGLHAEIHGETNMKSPSHILLAAGALAFALASPVFAEGTEPSTGQKIESTAEKTGDKMESAAEKTGDFLSDSALTAKVKTALIAEKDLKSMAINVESKNGVVTLTGELPTAASVTQAETAARNVKGVKEVQNHLTVKKS